MASIRRRSSFIKIACYIRLFVFITFSIILISVAWLQVVVFQRHHPQLLSTDVVQIEEAEDLFEFVEETSSQQRRVLASRLSKWYKRNRKNFIQSSFTAECTTIHIALGCTSYDQVFDAAVFIKSLLLHSRKLSVYMHIVTTRLLQHSVEVLFETWQLPNVEVVLYVNYKLKTSVSLAEVVEYIHQSGNTYSAQKLIVVKPEVYFLSDVNNVWKLVPHLTGEQGFAFIKASNILSSELVNKEEGDVLLVDSTTFKIANFKALVQEATNLMIESESLSFDIRRKPRSLLERRIDETYSLVAGVNGDMFRNTIQHCNITDPINEQGSEIDINATDDCFEYRQGASLVRRTHLNFINTYTPSTDESGAKISANQSVTLVTQLRTNRLNVLERFLSYWTGPAVVVIYATDYDAAKFIQFFQKSVFLQNRNETSYHVVYERQIYYPINYLRNVGISMVTTPYLLTLDVDFILRPGLSDFLAAILDRSPIKIKQALVIPAFETKQLSYHMAGEKSDFLNHLATNLVQPYKQSKRLWNLGHKYTDYERWKRAKTAYEVRGGFGYEPYVVVPREAPLYFEQLLERMRDKLAFTVELRVSGYKLMVLPEAWAVHIPHPKSDVFQWAHDENFKQCDGILYDEIIDEILLRYNAKLPKAYQITKKY